MFRFPWGDFHSLNLGWFLQKFNELREDWATAEAGIDGALDAEIQKAEDALTDVFAARDAAAASASAANSSALNASQSSIASMDARDQSRAARDAAQQAARNAAASETAAGNSATAASNSAGAAATSATQAGNSATAAGNSATAAGNSATAAGQSATNAAASETAAGNSAAAAAASETAAGQSATNAEEAAASVEASAQQIATNANNIDILKRFYPSAIFPLGKYATGQNSSVIIEDETVKIIRTIAGSFNLTGGIVTRYSGVTNIPQEDYSIKLKANTRIKIKIECLEDATYNVSGWVAYLQLAKNGAGINASRVEINGNMVIGSIKETYYTVEESGDYALYMYQGTQSGTIKFRLTVEEVPLTESATNLTTAIPGETAKNSFLDTVEESDITI